MALGFILAQPHLAEGFIFVVLIVLIGTPFWLYEAYKAPAKRRIFLINVVVWGVCLGIAFAVQVWRADTVRQQADMIVVKIEEYRQQTGHYPDSLDKLNISHVQLKIDIGMSGYSLSEEGEPTFFYASTLAPFDVYMYDFSNSEWIFKPD